MITIWSLYIQHVLEDSKLLYIGHRGIHSNIWNIYIYVYVHICMVCIYIYICLYTYIYILYVYGVTMFLAGFSWSRLAETIPKLGKSLASSKGKHEETIGIAML